MSSDVGDSKTWLLCSVVSAAAAIAVALLMPRGFATSLFYLPLILCGLTFARPNMTLVFAAAATLLSQLVYMLRSPGPVLPWIGPAHQLMQLATLWLTAILVFQHQKSLTRLRQSEARYQLLVRGLNVGEWDWNFVSGGFFCSPRLLEIMGIAALGIVTDYSAYIDRLHPDDLQRVSEHMTSHMRLGTPFDTEFRLRRQDGKYVWAHATGQGFRDPYGNVVRMVGSLEDISERKMAEERFEKVVEFSPYPIIVIDIKGEIALTNRQTEDLFGYARDELFGKNVERLIPERFQAGHPQHRSRFFHGPAAKSQSLHEMGRGTELFGLRKNGSEVPVEIGLIPMQTATASYVLCTIIDMTQSIAAKAQTHQFQEDLKRQVAERTGQLAASNRELEDFAAFASHDLKAPLRGIRAIAGFLEEDMDALLTIQSRSHLSQLNLRVRRMEKLLDDLLDYARISDPETSKSAEKVNGDVLMQEIVSLLAPPEQFRISILGPFASIRLRRMPLQQVLMNLLSNAIKHHDKPAGNISVAVEDAGTEYRFTVTDDGPGISKKFQERAFQMFQTLKPREQAVGSGMGLAVVRKHVGSVGGTLTLESEENAGCVFRFTWPK